MINEDEITYEEIEEVHALTSTQAEELSDMIYLLGVRFNEIMEATEFPIYSPKYRKEIF